MIVPGAIMTFGAMKQQFPILVALVKRGDR